MYRLRPYVRLKSAIPIYEGVEEISQIITNVIEISSYQRIAMETFPGVSTENLIKKIKSINSELQIIDTRDLFLEPEALFNEIQEQLTTDKVFGHFIYGSFEKFLDPVKLNDFHKKINTITKPIIIVGVCATQIIQPEVSFYLDINKWEIQTRFKEGMGNWIGYKESEFSEKLKRAYYFEWPLAKIMKEKVLGNCDYYIDMNNDDNPKMTTHEGLLMALEEFTKQPFRLVPFFDPGVWGGHWMQEKFNVGKENKNLAWCFDGVPEENSILMKTEDSEIEMPADNLVILYPTDLLGSKVYGRFGKDFPIRFDYLDTMGGQNLSLQVHPTLDYAYRNFGAKYTQDESYYVLDCEEGAVVYLGLKNGVDKEELVGALETAQKTGTFDDEKYINTIPIKKHDHILIPGGTIHSSGRNSVILEISTTPNRFTFKLWDWGRLDLDGTPRPISIHHGKHVINPQFTKDFVNNEFYNNTKVLYEEERIKEEHTGLHDLEPIETRRVTFSKKVYQKTENSVNMLNLVDGEHVQVVSFDKSFEPFDVYYGETFIIPEKVKEYYMVPKGETKEAIVMKAFIR